jgi:uncharacterized protein YjhX (UPF0386 family)
MKLSKAQAKVLQGLMEGGTLKVHRHLDGSKVYQLHPLEGEPLTLQEAMVRRLETQGLIESNKKFPAATYLLTEKGKEVAVSLATSNLDPLSSRKF